ncbi:hypothetical protein KORDIASMS9_03954 [Kordia sp. SMS9]|uniref:hypothetical protein n=1 Tax=Kordia sp. SMS9 TaxID=2282170 RepID=UPI000E0DF759|nr:hypothetical protein [Kordia sp. SMS9]AXG71697.1 hypothetical protein KORDIASMS9_03954 [Kordia sp. SMS9]
MKKPLFILFSFILLTSFQKKQKNDELLINNILLEVVSGDNSILDKKLKLVNGFNSALQIPAKFYFNDENFEPLAPYFKKEDIDYYKDQIKRNAKIKLLKKGIFKEFKFIKRKKIVNFIAKIESDFIKEKEFDYDKLYNKKIGGIQEFGLPLLSKNGKFLMIRFFSMPTSKKNKGFVRVYENINDNWVLKKTIREWENN